jgi:glycosyltransferase involved in cell wall biosynthesis
VKLLIHNGSRVWGGNEKWLADVAEGMLERGHRVTVSCRAEGTVRSFPRSFRFRLAFRRVDALVVNSEEIHAEWQRSAPDFPPEAVHVVFNGIHPPEPVSPDSRARVRAELGVPADAPLIAGIGHVYPRKGFDLLLEAFAALPVSEARLAIVGSGPREGELREHAARLGVADRVHWPGFRPDVSRVLGALRSRPEEVGARVEEARRRARERFSVERMVDGVERVLLGGKP